MFDLAAALAPQSPWAPVLLAAGVVGIGVIFTISIRARIASKNAARPSPRQLIEQLKAEGRRGDEIHGLAAELVQTAQRLAAQLDNKSRRLEVLLEQADRRIAALADTEAPPPETPSPANGARRQLDPLTRAVYEQADAGLDALEIARHLDEQVGKVELILALRE